ncbi:MAG: protein kinase [Deltaproteobacteria bacterium]|nr:protein kinase [Deltaproteobacteria bacterium]
MTSGSLAGQTIANRYDLLALLGRGGMGEVYRAHDRELDELVAFKVINPERASDPKALSYFRHEVKLARRVTHRNIARTFELGIDRGITYCTMELVIGETLAARLERGKLPVGEAAAIAYGLCEGLAAAHAAGVIHRDIKPGNVILALDGRPMLVDFGVAAIRASHSTVIAGTAGYMAPEQAHGDAPTPASDIYAVGVVLYEMLTGHKAFTGRTLEMLIAKQEIESLQLPEDGHTPREIASLIARATARDVTHRIADATEVASMLARWVGNHRAVTTTAPAGVFDLVEVIVLPPQGDDTRMHVAIGVHQALLDRLAKVPRLRVLPRTRVDKRVDAVVELRVTSALEVRVVRESGTLQLDLPLAAEDLRSIADAAAAAIVSAVEESRVLVDPQLAEATDLWLRGRAIIHRNITAVGPALELLERAYTLAPEDPRIAASLANVYSRMTYLHTDATDEMLARATELINSALRTGAMDADVHNAAGLLELNIGDAVVAARHFRTAIACAPYSAEAHDGLGRMLIEAGYLEDGMARLSDACAISPDITAAGWSIARMYALEGKWDECWRTVAEVSPTGGPRPVYDLRFALWRGDLEAVVQLRPQYMELVAPFQDMLAAGLFASLLEGGWLAWKDRLVAGVMEPTRNRRRTAFLCQMVAEIAGHVGDQFTCNAVITHAVDVGLFDLHWLDRCPLLRTACDTPEFRQARARVERRAQAILDALYGDHDSGESKAPTAAAPATVVG